MKITVMETLLEQLKMCEEDADRIDKWADQGEESSRISRSEAALLRERAEEFRQLIQREREWQAIKFDADQKAARQALHG